MKEEEDNFPTEGKLLQNKDLGQTKEQFSTTHTQEAREESQ